MALVQCDECGKTFYKRPCYLKRQDKFFCDQACSNIYAQKHNTRKVKIDFKIADNGCFECTSHKCGTDGYPKMRSGRLYRHVYQEMFGSIPKGMLIRHKCDNRKCINPEHLIIGTHEDNMRDACERDRIPRGSEKYNAKIDEEQAKEIKWFLYHSSLSYNEIAKLLSVTYSTINNIKSGKTWKHVPIPKN